MSKKQEEKDLKLREHGRKKDGMWRTSVKKKEAEK